jgi:membrane-associated phospholipid phosphatase
MKTLIATALLIAALDATTPARADAPDVRPLQPDPQFKIDPVTDLTFTAAMTGAAVLTGAILGTGEIVPQPVSPSGADKILSIDRVAVTQTIDPNAGRNSTIGLTLAMGFAVVDPLMTGFRQGWGSAMVDALMYAESLSTTTFVTQVTKIAVRRPRPIDYKNPGSSDTNAVLSYFSGHASSTASVAATATYLAFVRAPGTARPWITMGVGTLLTGFVSYERVRSGAHFPTDVIAGSMAGAAIGVLIPHLHHRAARAENAFWLGFEPAPGGGTVAFNKVF